MKKKAHPLGEPFVLVEAAGFDLKCKLLIILVLFHYHQFIVTSNVTLVI